MTDDFSSQDDAAQTSRQWQFSLRAALLVFVVLSILFSVASQFPRALMPVLMLVPLAVAAALRAPIVRFGMVSGDVPQRETRAGRGSIPKALLILARLLGLSQRESNPSLITGFATAIISSATLVGLWPVLREIGLMLALTSTQSVSETRQYALRSVPDAFSRGSYWLRLWQWELWSLGRWWLLFGAIMIAGLAASLPFNRIGYVDHISGTVTRFLNFAPWLIVLEVAFLIGVWIKSPNTVPEPSTGFVVGIFSWDLWHWDCWLDRGWLIRGVLPTFIAGFVFFASVLQWRWVASTIAALILVPVALLLSVACTVAYQNGLPPLL